MRTPELSAPCLVGFREMIVVHKLKCYKASSSYVTKMTYFIIVIDFWFSYD